jgi:hypothetical protein
MAPSSKTPGKSNRATQEQMQSQTEERHSNICTGVLVQTVVVVRMMTMV